MTKELALRTIDSIAPEIRNGVLSPVELTQYMLSRIEERDSELKSYATVMADQALDDAQRAAHELARGIYRGPLHGVPVAVKDLCNTAGIPTMGGCKVLADNVPDDDATVVRNLRNAGAVLLGKLNLTEGAMAGYNPEFQVPENPWKDSHWSGASSSGSGAATAAGLAYATLGSDTGGSIRHPAAACGTVGLKPTWGLVSRHGVLDLAQSLDHVGPLTRCSKDAGMIIDALAGPDPLDPTCIGLPAGCAEGHLPGSGSTPLKGLRVGWDEVYAGADLSPDFASKVAQAATVLEQLGADVVAVTMPDRLREYMAAWQVLCSTEAAHAHRATFPSRADEYGPWFREWLRRGREHSAIDYADANLLRLACVAELNRTLSQVDVLACPSSPRAAYPVSPEISFGPIPENRNPWDSRFTVPTDYAGLPTIALPCGLSDNGLPLSFQLVGHRLSEALLVAVGDAFEAATQWHELHPPGW